MKSGVTLRSYYYKTTALNHIMLLGFYLELERVRRDKDKQCTMKYHTYYKSGNTHTWNRYTNSHRTTIKYRSNCNLGVRYPKAHIALLPTSTRGKAHHELTKLANELRTQDNRITNQPIFIVEREVLDHGYDSEYGEEYVWVNFEQEYDEATETQARRLDAISDGFRDTGDWEKIFYKRRWEFVTACFTEEGCQRCIDWDGHNLGKTRIFAAGSDRNPEYQLVRDMLLRNY